jgi:ribosomal protein S18 acetylase RimI-like enzyme
MPRWDSGFISKRDGKVPGFDSLVKIDSTLVEPASITCARAFADDLLTAYLIPNEKKRANLHYTFEVPLRISAMGGAEAYATSPECEGVVIWMSSGMKQSLSMMLQAGYPRLPLRCGWRYFIRDAAMLRQCEKLRRKYAPPRHLYLGLLAVAPEHQGKGHASALLKPMLKALEEEKMACYLETQNMKNVAMYQHFGFKLVHETRMPGGKYPLYLMLRET